MAHDGHDSEHDDARGHGHAHRHDPDHPGHEHGPGGPGHEHGHTHAHSHDHTHAHSHGGDSHTHAHSHSHRHEHDHGPGDHAHKHHDHGPGDHAHHDHSHSHADHGPGHYAHEHHDHGPGDHAHGHHHHAPHAHDAGPAAEHKARAPVHVSAFVVTCSDSRDAARDESGRVLRDGLEAAGHTLAGSVVVKDDPDAIRGALEAARESGARAVLFTGGTGIGRRDCTVETLRPLFEKELPGFGELFRMLSYRQVGSAAMMSRATAGTYQGMILFALPGSPKAVRLALDALILPELGHAVRELSR
ncbi:MogA/MoaB family molybdenum cofactor biosynthesis protein [Comamonas sp. JC664]|uniref:MogA/MoaB family molybdenum cofactor biosynthesis protein n=1 Tax=Comamonas sp. JC664 TaxID=2801917 RepID=UPI00191ED516|nr:MogA/MoaB family molybdenum cofactor biosynthesis protein [Comamonas sp. JC664]MBL0693595.1 MogA/MoaB family molybdenum cofactor biosynthesis protein [Comamonas sp. JC664]